MSLLGFLKGLMIVAGDGIGKVFINVRFLRQHGHQREILVASRAEGPETLYVGNCHNSNQFTICGPDLETRVVWEARIPNAIRPWSCGPAF